MKPGKLTKDEFEVIKKHTIYGYEAEKIKAHGYETTCIFVVTNGDEYPDMKLHTGMDAVQGETVIAEF